MKGSDNSLNRIWKDQLCLKNPLLPVMIMFSLKNIFLQVETIDTDVFCLANNHNSFFGTICSIKGVDITECV